MILAFRNGMLYPDSPKPDLTYFDTHDVLSGEDAKAYFKANQILGNHGNALGGIMANTVTRRPFVGQVEYVNSPDDENTEFGIKRVGTAENIARQNLSATVRFVNDDGSDKYTTERDFPMGDLKMETIKLALASWNIVDDNGSPVSITPKNVVDYLSPAEFEFVYEKCLDVNPMWRNGGESDTKKN